MNLASLAVGYIWNFYEAKAHAVLLASMHLIDRLWQDWNASPCYDETVTFNFQLNNSNST